MRTSKKLMLVTLVGCCFLGGRVADAGIGDWLEKRYEDVKKGAKKAGDDLKKVVDDAKDKAEDTLADAKDKVTDGIGQLVGPSPAQCKEYFAEMKRRDSKMLNAATKFGNFLNSNDSDAVKIRRALKAKDYATAGRLLQRSPEFKSFSSTAQHEGFQTTTVGLAVDAAVIVGGSLEGGVAIDNDHSRRIRVYGTTSLSIGISAGADGCIVLGWWKARNDQLAGKSYGVIGSVSYGVSVNYGAWFERKEDRNKFLTFPESCGRSLAIGAGIGAEIGEFNTATTHQKS